MNTSTWARIASVVSDRFVDKDKKAPGPFGSPMDTPVRGADMDELYRRLQPAGRRPKAGAEPVVAAAVEAAQRSAAELDAENAAQDVTPSLALDAGFALCSACGYRNRKGNRSPKLARSRQCIPEFHQDRRLFLRQLHSLERTRAIITITIITITTSRERRTETFRGLEQSPHAKTRCARMPRCAVT
jgi:hypothetical protein